MEQSFILLATLTCVKALYALENRQLYYTVSHSRMQADLGVPVINKYGQ